VAKKEFGLKMALKDPPQPAQSPDLNLLNTFFFRILFIKFRWLRAQVRVKAAAQGLRERVEQVEENDEDKKGDRNFDNHLHNQQGVVKAGEFRIVKQKRVPLRYKKYNSKSNPKCPSCLKVVKPDNNYYERSFYRGCWHIICVEIKWKQDNTL
jgi:hypothetical protein